MNGVEVCKHESYEFGEESSFIVTFVRQLCNSRLQRYRRFLKGVPALNDKRSVRGSYRLICQAGLNATLYTPPHVLVDSLWTPGLLRTPQDSL